MIDFKEVNFGSTAYKETLNIRDEVLRKPIGMKLREKDIANDGNEFHLAAFEADRAVGCVLLRPLNQSAIQLRQMAILDSHRGKNIGAQLVFFAEQYASKKGFSVIETRARKTAQGFYSKLGYQPFENEFCDEHTLLMRKPIIKS